MEAKKLNIEPWRVFRPVVAGSTYHFNEEQDPDPHQRENSDPDRIEKRDAGPY
jgi:hypothetical protein